MNYSASLQTKYTPCFAIMLFLFVMLIEPFKCLCYSSNVCSNTVGDIVIVKPIFKFANNLFCMCFPIHPEIES